MRIPTPGLAILVSSVGLWFAPSSLLAYGHWEGYCQQGGQKVVTSSISSTTSVQQSYPLATLTVYITGTGTPGTKATLYSDNNATPLANPLTCSSKGYFSFYSLTDTFDLTFSGTGISAPFTWGAVQQVDPSIVADYINVKASPWNAVCDGTADDTAAIISAVTYGASVGRAVTFPSVCAVSSVAVTTTGKVMLDGAGGLIRVASALQAHTSLMVLSAPSSVTIGPGFYFNQLSNDSTRDKACLEIASATNVDIEGATFLNCQSQGVQIQAAGNGDVRVANNYFNKASFLAIDIAGGGNTTTPSIAHRITVTGNTVIDAPFGIVVTIYANECSITGNSLTRAAIGLIQENAVCAVTGNALSGSATYGILSAYLGSIYIEGSTDSIISGNSIGGGALGIVAQGSTLVIAPGPTLQLPIHRLMISNNEIDSVPGAAITLSAASVDGTAGTGNTIKGNHITQSHVGMEVSGVDGVSITGNSVDTPNFDCYELAGVHGIFSGNIGRNCSSAAANSFFGVKLDGSTSQNWDWSDNEMIDDQASHTMLYGFYDKTLADGNPSQVRSSNNKSFGSTSDAFHPVPAIPTLGAWLKGQCIQMLPASTNLPLGWCNTTAGSPGTWASLPYVRSTMCANNTITNVPCGDSSYGYFTIAASATFSSVFTSAIPAVSSGVGAVVTVNQVQGTAAGTILGVTCASTVTPVRVSDIGAGGGSFTASVSVAPVTNPGCYMYTIFNPNGK